MPLSVWVCIKGITEERMNSRGPASKPVYGVHGWKIAHHKTYVSTFLMSRQKLEVLKLRFGRFMEDGV